MNYKLSILFAVSALLLTACDISSVVRQFAPHDSEKQSKTPTVVTYGIALRVEPIIVGNLGDRVIGPATIYVDAPGATRVEVYLMPVDQPVGGKPSGDPRVIASINHQGDLGRPADSYAIPWAADEPFAFVEIWAVAYGQPDVNYSRASPPMPLILQFQPKK